jgi:DNA-binding winged helix-turn-helix (wHTH) protein/tetratricopeptide (TPR) repeat protein
MSRHLYLLIGDWTVDPSTGQATRGSQTVHLTPRAVDLLRVLADRAGEVVTSDELMDVVWRDVVVAPDALYSVVAALRRSLGDDSHHPRYIETIPKRGYRMVAPVERLDMVGGRRTRWFPRWQRLPRRGLAGATIMMAAIVATASLVRNQQIHDAEPILRLALVSSAPTDSAQGQTQRSLSDELVRKLVSQSSIEVETVEVPPYNGENNAIHAAAGRSAGADAVIVIKVGDADDIRVQLIDTASEVVRASFPVAMDVNDAGSAAEALVKRISAEFEIDGSKVHSLSHDSLLAREKEILGRYYLQERFTPFADPRKMMQKAVAAFAAATEADPDYIEGWTGLALAWVLSTSYESDTDKRRYCIDRSREVIRRALALNPASAEAYAAMGLAYVFEQNPMMARAVFEQSLDIQPDNPMVLRWISRTMYSLGEFHLRAVYATRAAELAPFSRQFLADAANASALIGDFDATFRWMNAQLALDPTDADAINNLIVYRRDAGWLAEAINLGPRLASSLEYQYEGGHGWQFLPGMMANLFTQIDAPHMAEALIRQAEESYPDDEYTHWARSSYHLARGDTPRAKEHIPLWAAAGQITATLAVHAVMAGMNEYAAELFAQVRPPERFGSTANPNLVHGQWLNVLDLGIGSLAGVYLAYIEEQSGNQLVKETLLDETMKFLNVWIHQGVALPWAYYYRAAVHAMQGRPAQGIVDLEAAVDAGFSFAWRLRIDPILLNLHGHPEFQALLQRVADDLSVQRVRIGVAATQVEYEPRYGRRIR